MNDLIKVRAQRLDGLDTGAVFSQCRKYRFTLWRIWGRTDNLVNFLMLNPSKANEMDNDPTVERCQRRAEKWGYDGIIVTNLFAFMATDPAEMKSQENPIGERNDDCILESACSANVVVCAWGTHGKHMGRAKDVLKLLRPFACKLHALKVSINGEPYHPLYLPYDLELVKFGAAS